MYPQPSSWMSTDEGSAWFFRITPTRQICSTTGWDALLDIQSAIRDRLATTGPLPTWDNSIVSERDVPDGGSWDEPLLKVLFAVAQVDLQAGSSAIVQARYLDEIENDARRRAIGEKTLALALWVAYVSHSFGPHGEDILGTGSPAQVTFPSGRVLLPSFGVSVPQPQRTSVTGVRCTRPEAIPGGVNFTPGKLLMAGFIGLGIWGMLSLSKKAVVRRPRK